VESHLRELHRTYDVKEVAYDPAYFERSAQALADDGLPMVEFPQSAQRMVPACQTAYELICGGLVEHDGNPVFSDQVLAAVPRETDSGWRISKGKSKRKIDAAVAMVIAVARATARDEAKKTDLRIW
jgi:phage terminase large subunit-like protein